MGVFRIRNGFHIVIRHACEFTQYLGIKFSDEEIAAGSILVTRRETDEPNRVSCETVKEEVVAGMTSINEQLGTRYHVSEILFYGCDSPQPNAYFYLTRCIVFRWHTEPEKYEAGDRLVTH